MYKLTDNDTIIRLSDNAFIPANPDNRDFAEYLEWKAEGNIPEAADPIDHMTSLRDERNTKLAASDWTQLADAPADQAAWAVYRQALRDLPANTPDPANPVWPQEP